MRFCLLGQARGRLGKCQRNKSKCVVRIDLGGTPQVGKATAILAARDAGPAACRSVPSSWGLIAVMRSTTAHALSSAASGRSPQR